MVSLKKTKPTPFQKDTWLSRTFWQHSERSDLKINFQGITRRGFNCPFVLARPETTSGGADGGRALRREDTIRESGRAQAAAHSLQQLKACRWKWSCFLSWRESTQVQWLPDWAWFTGRGGEASGACSSERSRCFKGRRISPHCKVSFPRKEPRCCIKQSTQLFVKDFFLLLLELYVNRLIAQSWAALTKPTHQVHKRRLRKGHLREVMVTGSASFLFLFRLILDFHSFLFIPVFCFLMENRTKDFYLDIYW